MAVQVSTERYQAFDIGSTKNRWAIPTNGAESMVVSGEAHTTWGAAVITLYQSLDGITPYAIGSAVALSTSNGWSGSIDCSLVPFIVAELSTKGTSGTYANLIASRSVSR